MRRMQGSYRKLGFTAEFNIAASMNQGRKFMNILRGLR